MTNKQLREKLKKFPDDMEVVYFATGTDNDTCKIIAVRKEKSVKVKKELNYTRYTPDENGEERIYLL